MSDIKMEQPTQSLAIGVGAMSETGQREQNQDYMTGFSSPFGAVYLIADGMGGHRGGAEASRLVGEAFSRHLLAAPGSVPVRDALTLAVRLANIEVLEKGKSGNPDLQGMGSTVVIALVGKNGDDLQLTTAHVGDSRIYLQRDGALTLLTKDHTQIQWLIDTKALDEVSARNHPDASVLTRAIGHTVELEVDISDPIPLNGGDAILLCSDGLSGFVADTDIRQSIEDHPDPTICVGKLVELALACGSSDNITVQFLRIGEAIVPAPDVPSGVLAVRGRSRQTQPEQPVPLPPKPAGWRRRLPAIILSITLALTLAAAAYGVHRAWVRRHAAVGAPQPPTLSERIKTLRDKVARLDGDTTTLQIAVDKDLNSSGSARFRGLHQKFTGLKADVGTIVAEVHHLERDLGDEANEAARPEKVTGQATATKQVSPKQLLEESVTARDGDYNRLRGKLDDANKTRTKLEQELSHK